jgi:hypothetical protein
MTTYIPSEGKQSFLHVMGAGMQTEQVAAWTFHHLGTKQVAVWIFQYFGG